MPRIDPQQLLNCLSVLLASNGGIKSSKEVNRLVLLMGKFSKKLVSKCIYVQILKSTETELLGQFMADGGWALSHTWLQDGILTRNWPLVQELLELLLLCPVDVQRLKSNSAPKLVKGLCKEGGNEGVRILASKLVEQWLKIVKGETSSLTPVTMPRQDVIVDVLKPELPDVKQENIENSDLLDEADEEESQDMIDPLEIPSNHVPEEDTDSKERLAKAKNDGLVFKITVKDGKQVLAKVESSPKKEADAEKAKAKSELNVKAKNEPVVKSDWIAKVKIETVDGKKQIKEKSKKESAAVKEQDKGEASKKSEKSKNETAKEKSKSDDKERRSSKESTKESADGKDKDKERRKDSSSKSSSSSKHNSSRSSSSSHKSSRSSSDGKHKSSSRDKSKDSSEKDRDKDRSSKSSSSSSKSKSGSSSSSKPKEKRDSIDDKISQSMKDKDTLTKVIPPSINKLGKIPKKPAGDSDAATESVPKKPSISIEVKKDTENRPKTVKTFNSQFRSHGLAEEAPPPPSRRGLQRPSSQPTAGASIPATILTKRSSPPPEKKDAVVPEKKLKIDTSLAAADKPGIKLIPAKPKTPVLVESDMFMDAIFASQTTKKDSARKRKRLTSQTTAETTKSEKVQSPDAKSVAPKFYQDTLDNENKDEDRPEDAKKKDENDETTKAENESGDVEMQEASEPIETKDTENVVVENKKPPGPGCGPNGPPGVLTILKRKGPKKQLKWKPQESLEEVHYFELDETERVNVSRTQSDMSQPERFGEREGEAFLIARKMNADDSMTEQVPWKALHIVDDVPPPPLGSSSKEKKIQFDRESTCLRAIYFTRSMIPDSPAEPDMEHYQITDATIIPLDDANGSPDGIKSFVNYPWPEPRGSPPHQSIGFDDQPPFNNFPPNFPFNNQPGWTQPNVIPPAFNGPPHNMLNLNAMQPEPMNNMNNMNMNMNPNMPPFQQNANFGPPNGMRNNFNGNFGNGNDGRMHPGGPQQNNNPNWFRPNGPQNNWRPPMGNNNHNNNNNNRSRLDWNPRNICRSFSKGFCRNGDKCQWLHPGINCPPFN